MTTTEIQPPATSAINRSTATTMKALVYHDPGKRAWEDTPRPKIQAPADAIVRHKPKVLFLSTGNATRGLIAEGFLRTLTGDRFDVASAGAEPSALNPLAGEVIKEAGIDISGQQPQKIAQSLKEHFGYVVAICDAAKERSPIFPFTLNLRQWSIADPNSLGGLPGQKTEVFRRVRDEIEGKVKQFITETPEVKALELSIG